MVCSNPHHGCGWTDPAGARRGRSRVLPAREFIKRLYAAVKARRPDGFIDCHGSGYVCPVRAAWVDRLYIGELYRKVPFTFEHFTIACRGEPHGMATDALWWHGLAFPFERMLAFTLLHDIEPRPMLWKRDQVAVMERLWKVKDAFDTDNAEWRPYWNADGLVRAAGAGCYASLYLHRGRRGLVVLSNTGDQPATAEATLALARLGLRGEARDAFTGEAVPLAGGKAAVPLPGPGLKLIWVE
jgi:hypothetical protein